MSHPFHSSISDNLFEIISEEGFEGMGKAIQILMNEAMKIERSKHLQAGHYERSGDRAGYANGFKPKEVATRVGVMELQIPQVRKCDFYPASLERGLRSEKALKLAVAEMYIQGVSTRRVAEITKVLCGVDVSSSDVSRAALLLDEEMAKWRGRPLGKIRYMVLDALYEKTRRDGCVADSAVLIAYGINEAGGREILGISVSLSEQEAHWRSFMESLVTPVSKLLNRPSSRASHGSAASSTCSRTHQPMSVRKREKPK